MRLVSTRKRRWGKKGLKGKEEANAWTSYSNEAFVAGKGEDTEYSSLYSPLNIH